MNEANVSFSLVCTIDLVFMRSWTKEALPAGSTVRATMRQYYAAIYHFSAQFIDLLRKWQRKQSLKFQVNCWIMTSNDGNLVFAIFVEVCKSNLGLKNYFTNNITE